MAMRNNNHRSVSHAYLFPYMEESIQKFVAVGKIRTAETYRTTLLRFKRFRQDEDIRLASIDDELISGFERSLKESGLCANTTSFYMRILRAVYNKALKAGLIKNRTPFKYVYTGVDKTRKRAIDIEDVRRLAALNLDDCPAEALARDLFLFSFYMRGMSFVDMAYLQKRDLHCGVLSYRRRKTGQTMFIRWENCMQKIIDRYPTRSSPYLLPIITSTEKDARSQYIYMIHKVNDNLKTLGRRLGFPVPLTMYVARHTWASTARRKNIPLAVISEGMGHTSEKTTRIYLDSLDASAIDDANLMILEML